MVKKIIKEQWYMSRRIWGAVLTLLVTVGLVVVPGQSQVLLGLGSLVATYLGLNSWVKPKV